MKKTQKILALVMAVLMVASCFGMTVFAEEVAETEMITVVGVEMVGDNEYVVEFSAPVTYKYLWSTFRRPSVENGTGQNVKAPAVEYLGEVEEVDGRKYSNLIKLTFEAADPALHLGKYGFVIAEYGQTGEAKGDIAGAISPAVVCGKNGELVKSNYTNAKGDMDFVWIPTHSLDGTGSKYAVHIENVYQDNIEIIAVDVSEDFSTYTLHFSAPVKIGDKSRIWFRPASPETGTGQVYPSAVEYLGDTVKYGEADVYSDTVKLTIDPNGGTEGGKTLREASKDFTDYGISFSEYGIENNNEGYIHPGVVHGLNGLVMESNYYKQRDFYWIPTVGADAEHKYKVHLSFGEPYVVGATWHAESEEILVEFSENVTFDAEAIGAYLCVGGPESETKVALTASATDKDNVVAFTVGELPEAFAEGKYGIAFADGYIKDAGEKALAVNYAGEEANFCYIPTASADAENEYPVNLDVHTATKMESDAENHWTVCECGEIIAGSTTAHDYKVKSDAETHWTECECGAKTEAVAHEFETKSDAETHWTECECGAKTEAAAHDYKVKSDAETHWTECECGAKTEAVAHEYTEAKSDAENHWKECACGAKAEVAAHDYKVKSDAETHWTECECGAKTEAAAHDYKVKSDAETHWTECECGAKTEAVAHDYKVKSDAETHWTECECGAKTEAEAHDFSESNTCPVCGEESYIAGDVDGNDKVEAADAIHLLYYTFFGAERYPVNQPCDFDGNGEVEAADAIYLLYFTFFGAERYPLN